MATRSEIHLPSAPIAAIGIIGGYAVARATKVRALGGLVLGVAGVVAGREWLRRGPVETAALGVIYLGAFGASHPLAKKIGAWPSVLTVAAAAAGTAYAVSDRRR